MNAGKLWSTECTLELEIVENVWRVSLLTKVKKPIDVFILLNVSQILYSNDNSDIVQIIFQQQLNKPPMILKFPDSQKNFLNTVKKIFESKPSFYSRNFIC